MANAPKPVPDDDGWQEITEEFPTRVQFDVIGDEFIGTFLKTESIEDGYGKTFLVWQFHDCIVNGQPALDPKELYSVGQTARLKPTMKTVRPGRRVRMRYVADIPTNHDSPMKDIRVAIK